MRSKSKPGPTVPRVHSKQAGTLLQLAMQKTLAEFVALILKYYTPAGTAEEKYETYFTGILSSSSLKALRRGVPIERRLIRAFADGTSLEPLDRRELFIRWGEAYLGECVYYDDTGLVERWIDQYDDAPPKAMRRVMAPLTFNPPKLVEFVRGWSNRNLGKGRGLEIRAIASRLDMSESGLQKALVTGGMKRTPFLQFQKTLRLPADLRQNLAQYFIEAQVGEAIVPLDPKILEDCLNPHLHLRYLHWLLANRGKKRSNSRRVSR